MFSVFKFLGVIILVVSVVLDVARADECGEKSPMTCYCIDNGIIWCLQPLNETTEHSVSFLQDTDDRSAYKTVVNFLGKRKPAKIVKKLLLACKARLLNKKMLRTYFCRDCDYQFVHEHRSEVLKSNIENSGNVASSSDSDLPAKLELLYVGTEKKTDSQLQTRSLQNGDVDCKVCDGKSLEEIHGIIMDIIRARFERGYYSPTPHYTSPRQSRRRGKPSIKNTYMQVRQIVREIRNGAVQVYQKVKQTKLGGKVIQRTKSLVPKGQTRYKSVPPQYRPKPQEPVAIPKDESTPSTSSSSPNMAPGHRLLLEKNSRVINRNPDAPYLIEEKTPNTDLPENWSRPVDAIKLRNRLLELEELQREGLSLRP